MRVYTELPVLVRPDKFKNIVLSMGSFHMAKVALGCLGNYLKGSGAEYILTESCVFGPNVVEPVLNGKNYVRSVAQSFQYIAVGRILKAR